VSRTTSHTSELVTEGTRRILARATDSRALDVCALRAHKRGAAKVFTARRADATTSQVNEFFDQLHADDLC
jgi:hypothetical protein